MFSGMSGVDMVSSENMERWRNYFGKAGTDIWSVITQAIHVAAADHPKDFIDKRGDIAETLFCRSLLMKFDSSKDDDHSNMLEEGEVRDAYTGSRHAYDDCEVDDLAQFNHDDGHHHHEHHNHHHDNTLTDHDQRILHDYHDEAEALTDEIQEETMSLKELETIKATIDDPDQSEKILLETLQRLTYMRITVEDLKATEIGKHVNNLRKHSSKKIRNLVKELVRQWKALVDDWVRSAGAAVTTNSVTECGEFVEEAHNQEGLPSPPLDECALLQTRASSEELSQLFSFIDEGICGQSKEIDNCFNSIDSSVKDNVNYSTKSQSGSMLTDTSDIDGKTASIHTRTPEERGSATRDLYVDGAKKESALKGQTSQYQDKAYRDAKHNAALQVPKIGTHSSGAARFSNVHSKVKDASASAKTLNDRHNRGYKSTTAHANSIDKTSTVKPNKPSVDQKLEIAKRKLHQGYQQAENAKKQRNIQVLDIPDLPKSGQAVMGTVNTLPAHRKPGHWNQNRRYL